MNEAIRDWCGICDEQRSTHDVVGDDYTGPVCDDCDQSHWDAEIARLGLVIYKLNRRIASKRRQVKGKDRALLRWRRWAEATFFGGVRGGGRDADLQQRIVDALRGDREAGSTPKGCVQPE